MSKQNIHGLTRVVDSVARISGSDREKIRKTASIYIYEGKINSLFDKQVVEDPAYLLKRTYKK